MPGFTAQSGNVIIASQPTQGTTAPLLTTAGVGLKILSGSIGPDRDPIMLEKEIGAGRDQSDVFLGPVKYSGEYSFYPRFNSLVTLLRAALGTANSVTTTGVTTHTITPTDGQLPFLSVYEEWSSAFERFIYTDAVVNTFGISIDPTGIVQCTAGLIAISGASGAADIDPTSVFDNTRTLPAVKASITLNGVDLKPRSFSLNVNNNVEDDDFRVGSLGLADVTAKGREVSGSVSLRHTNSSLFKRAVWGNSAATAPTGLTTQDQLVLTLTSYENIGATTEPHSASFTIPKTVLNPFKMEMSGDDALDSDVDFTAIRPDTAVPILTAVVKNGKTAIA